MHQHSLLEGCHCISPWTNTVLTVHSLWKSTIQENPRQLLSELSLKPKATLAVLGISLNHSIPHCRAGLPPAAGALLPCWTHGSSRTAPEEMIFQHPPNRGEPCSWGPQHSWAVQGPDPQPRLRHPDTAPAPSWAARRNQGPTYRKVRDRISESKMGLLWQHPGLRVGIRNY